MLEVTLPYGLAGWVRRITQSPYGSPGKPRPRGAVIDTKEMGSGPGVIPRGSTRTSCCWAKGRQRFIMSQTPTATPSRVIDTVAGKGPSHPHQTIQYRPFDPGAPPAPTQASLAPSRPMKSILPGGHANTTQPRRDQRQGAGCQAPPLGFISHRLVFPRRFEVSRDGKTIYVTKRQGPELEGPIAKGITRPLRGRLGATAPS